MFKSITGKFFAIYLCIIIGSFIVLAAILPPLINDYFLKQKEDLLVQEGEIISQQYVLAYITGVMDERRLNDHLEILDSYLNARIWLVDSKGTVYLDSNSNINTSKGKTLANEAVQSALKGNIVKIRGSNFGGYFDDLVLTVGYPIMVNDEAKGAIFMHAPLTGVIQTVKVMNRLIWICLLVSLLIAFILIYIFTRQLINPLKQMNTAANDIANGDFQKRVPIDTEDEVGQLAHSFNNMAGELNKLEELRKSFIANISHDFRSPLTSVKGFISAILDGTIPKESQDHYLEIVLDETERLSKLTANILDLTSMEAGEMKLDKSVFDIHIAIKKIIKGLEQRILEKEIEIELVMEEKQILVYADLEKIQRVIYNIVDNAIKFIEPKGQIKIETSILHHHKVQIKIEDNGPGIPAEDLKYIWDRFHKADRSRGKHKKGTGLGLSIVKQIIKYHEEKIEVNSEEGEGTQFTFTLPIYQEGKES